MFASFYGVSTLKEDGKQAAMVWGWSLAAGGIATVGMNYRLLPDVVAPIINGTTEG
jgi:hypothetical protein